jgi:hypothetical protein
MVSSTFTTALKAVTDDALEELKSKNPNQTLRNILLYGRFEDFFDSLEDNIKHLLRDEKASYTEPVRQCYDTLFRELTQAFMRCRESIVGPEVLKDLRQVEINQAKPDSDFQLFARRCCLNVFELCLDEYLLIERFFFHTSTWSEHFDEGKLVSVGRYAEELEQMRLSHIKTLDAFLTPYLIKGDLDRICNLIYWLETTFLGSAETRQERIQRINANVLLRDHLWPLCDSLFIKAARDLERFKPSADDLRIGGVQSGTTGKSNTVPNIGTEIEIANDPKTPAPSVSTAYPTVKTAVRLLVLYNESTHERPASHLLLFSDQFL